jgi:hypothetical protein
MQTLSREKIDCNKRSRKRGLGTRGTDGDSVNEACATREDRNCTHWTEDLIARLDSERCPVRRHWNLSDYG